MSPRSFPIVVNGSLTPQVAAKMSNLFKGVCEIARGRNKPIHASPRRSRQRPGASIDSRFVRGLIPTFATVTRSKKIGMRAYSSFTPERYETCPALFSRHRFARTCSRCSRPLRCSPPPRMTSPPATRSTRPSTIPTNYFTAQALNNRASDISNLLDSIGNGVQVLQAANTGITSLQSLVASAQSIANQVLQSPVGYSTKSNVTSGAIAGATATNLLGNGTNATVTGTAVINNLRTRGRDHRATKLVVRGRPRTHWPRRPRTGRPLPSTARPSPSRTGADRRVTTDGSGNVDDRRRRRQHGDVQTVLTAIDGITGAWRPPRPSTVPASSC